MRLNGKVVGMCVLAVVVSGCSASTSNSTSSTTSPAPGT